MKYKFMAFCQALATILIDIVLLEIAIGIPVELYLRYFFQW